MGAKPPQLDGDGIALAVSHLSRAPFQEVLTHLLEAAPDRKNVNAFAKKYPLRWAQTVAIFARLGGYHDKLEIDDTTTLDWTRLTDAELDQRILELDQQILELQEELEEGGYVFPVRKQPSPN